MTFFIIADDIATALCIRCIVSLKANWMENKQVKFCFIVICEFESHCITLNLITMRYIHYTLLLSEIIFIVTLLVTLWVTALLENIRGISIKTHGSESRGQVK